MGAVSVLSGFLWGAVSDRIGRGKALGVSFLLQGAAALLLAWWTTMPGIVLSALLCGITAVATPGIVGAACGDRFGPLLASTSLGFLTLLQGVGQVAGPYLAGWM